MAEFEPAYERTNGAEGGYVNDLTDPGGETYGGISRRYHPTWPGWKIVDLIKGIDKDYRHKINTDARLKGLKETFYRQTYWDALRLGELHSQEAANEIYDNAINTGISNAIKTAQRLIDLPQTGKVDSRLIDVLNHV